MIVPIVQTRQLRSERTAALASRPDTTRLLPTGPLTFLLATRGPPRSSTGWLALRTARGPLDLRRG
jgi:hypothetical protein